MNALYVVVCMLLQNWMSATFRESSPSVQSHSPVPSPVHRIETSPSSRFLTAIFADNSTVHASRCHVFSISIRQGVTSSLSSSPSSAEVKGKSELEAHTHFTCQQLVCLSLLFLSFPIPTVFVSYS